METQEKETRAEKQWRLRSQVFTSPNFTRGEKRVLEYQFRTQDDRNSFFNTLMYAIHLADDDNMERLAEAFPEEVAAVRRWRRGDLCRVWQDMGIDV